MEVKNSSVTRSTSTIIPQEEKKAFEIVCNYLASMKKVKLFLLPQGHAASAPQHRQHRLLLSYASSQQMMLPVKIGFTATVKKNPTQTTNE